LADTGTKHYLVLGLYWAMLCKTFKHKQVKGYFMQTSISKAGMQHFFESSLQRLVWTAIHMYNWIFQVTYLFYLLFMFFVVVFCFLFWY